MTYYGFKISNELKIPNLHDRLIVEYLRSDSTLLNWAAMVDGETGSRDELDGGSCCCWTSMFSWGTGCIK